MILQVQDGNRERNMMNHEKLSKEVSYALRHAPWEYEFEMDEEGWVNTEQLLRGDKNR